MLLSILLTSTLLTRALCNQYPYQPYSQQPPPPPLPYPNSNVDQHQQLNQPIQQAQSQSQYSDDRSVASAPSFPQYSNQIYRRGYPVPPPVKQESFLSKVKNSIVAASNAIAGTFDSSPGGDQGGYGYTNENYPNSPPGSYQQQRMSGYENSYDRRPMSDMSTGKNLVGKIKSLFGGDEQRMQVPHEHNNRYPNPSVNQHLPPQMGNSGSHLPQSQRISDPPPQTGFNGYPEYSYPSGGPGEIVESARDSGELSQFSSFPNIPPQYSQPTREDPVFPNHHMPPSLPSRPPHIQPPPSTRPPHEEMLERISSEPQVLIHEDNVVMILKPKEFYRKKYALITGGSNNLQVFTDFEHAFTRFKTDSPFSTSEKPATEKSFSTSELLEMSGALSAEALQRIQQLTNEYDQNFCQLLNEEGNCNNDVAMYQLYEEMSAQYQQIIAKFGNLYSGNILPTTKEMVSRVGLRQGWKETLQALASKGVPTFIFSSGFGDIITNIMLLNDLTESNPPSQYGTSRQGASHVIPNNIRIISNFFRTAPDYSVRGFSQPIVHEKNKNITTAEKLMGMPVPSRPNALVLGSHEDDIRMTEGLSNLQNQLSIGFLELSDDLPQRLSSYLNTFDAVIVGDSSCSFIKGLVEDLLALSHSNSQGAPSKFSGIVGFGNIRNKIGQLLGDNSGTTSPSTEKKRNIDFSTF